MSDFKGDTPRTIAYRRAQMEALCYSATMMRNRGPAKLIGGEWVYGLDIWDCILTIDRQLRG